MVSASLLVLAVMGTVDPPRPPGVAITFDERTHRFVLRNVGGAVSFTGYNRSQPMHTVQRLTPDGWVQSYSDWCGTGTHRYRLEPGQTIEFRPQVGVSAGNLRFFGLDKKYPDFLKYDVRVGISVMREGGTKHEMIWSEKMKPPR